MLTNTEKQKCSKCNISKDLSEFHRRGNSYQKICRDCRCAEARDGYRDHGKSRTPRPILQVNTANFPELEERITALEPRLRSTAARFAHDVLESDDIYSEMVTRILTRCKPADNDAFLVQCAKWAAQAYTAKRQTASHYSADLDPTEEEEGLPGLEAAARSVEDEIIQNEALEQFRAVIASLPAKHQRIVAMISVGMKQREISARLAVSEQTVSERMKAIRADLLANLQTDNGVTFAFNSALA